MEVRTLRPGEREALLDLLDGWDPGDGWRGRDFFRRYIADDPSFADVHVQVALEGGRPVSCVQLFPRALRLGERAVPVAGLGSVFTAASHRRRGIAESLLARSVAAAGEAGMELSLLFATRIPWYTRLGWRSWGWPRLLVERAAAKPGFAAGLEVTPFSGSRDLAEIRELHERFDRDRDGSVLRDDGLWRASLANAGNPDEEFLVARSAGDGSLQAYARAALLLGFWTLLEFAHTEAGAEALAELVVRLLAPRAEDPLAARAGVAGDARARLLAGPARRDPALQAALRRRGARLGEFVDTSAMLRCLDAPALARRLELRLAPGERPEALLTRVLSPERFAFWPADRF